MSNDDGLAGAALFFLLRSAAAPRPPSEEECCARCSSNSPSWLTDPDKPGGAAAGWSFTDCTSKTVIDDLGIATAVALDDPPFARPEQAWYNCRMVMQGVVQNGLIVLSQSAGVPDGTRVTVLIPSSDGPSGSTDRDRRRAALAELLAMPDENPGDTVSGADHDRVLYGEPG